MMYVILSIPTLIYVWASAARDIKERLVYTFPAMVLSIIWWTYGMYLCRDHVADFCIPLFICILLYAFMNKSRLWGGGDSDIFLVFFGFILCSMADAGRMAVMFCLFVFLAIAMTLAIIAGVIEGVVRKKKVDRYSGVAVVPGFAMVMSGIFLMTINGRF